MAHLPQVKAGTVQPTRVQAATTTPLHTMPSGRQPPPHVHGGCEPPRVHAQPTSIVGGPDPSHEVFMKEVTKWAEAQVQALPNDMEVHLS